MSGPGGSAGPQRATASIPIRPLGRVVAITSGKGGVGKTFVAANLAAALARRGQRVLLLDAYLGLTNLDSALNLIQTSSLHDVFTGKADLGQAIIQAPGGFSVLLAGLGLLEHARLTPDVRDEFLRVIASLAPRYDLVLLDTGAGISDVVLFSVSLASVVLLVATPELSALSDAYATVKVLAGQQKRSRIHLVVNHTARLGDGRAITAQLQQVLDRYVVSEPGQGIRLSHLADIPADAAARQAAVGRQLLWRTAPACPSALAVEQLACRLEETVLIAQA
ncbi:MAG: AAA family ATPase [Burkholderiaceae bacterium]|jgi:flagellar biosynthesis protein FlhG